MGSCAFEARLFLDLERLWEEQFLSGEYFGVLQGIQLVLFLQFLALLPRQVRWLLRLGRSLVSGRLGEA